MSPEDKEARRNAISLGIADMSPEDREAWRNAISLGRIAYLANMSPEDREAWRNAISLGMIAYHANMSPEVRAAWRNRISDSLKAFWARLSPEERLARMAPANARLAELVHDPQFLASRGAAISVALGGTTDTSVTRLQGWLETYQPGQEGWDTCVQKFKRAQVVNLASLVVAVHNPDDPDRAKWQCLNCGKVYTMATKTKKTGSISFQARNIIRHLILCTGGNLL